MAKRHGKCKPHERESQQDCALEVEACLPRHRTRLIDGKIEPCNEQREQAQRHVDEENGRPAEVRNQQPSQRGTKRVPIADMVTSSPMAIPVFDRGTASPTNAMVRAIMTAAPIPCATRATINNHNVAAAHSAEAAVKTASLCRTPHQAIKPSTGSRMTIAANFYTLTRPIWLIRSRPE